MCWNILYEDNCIVLSIHVCIHASLQRAHTHTSISNRTGSKSYSPDLVTMCSSVVGENQRLLLPLLKRAIHTTHIHHLDARLTKKTHHLHIAVSYRKEKTKVERLQISEMPANKLAEGL